jgi:hypothetical protein
MIKQTAFMLALSIIVVYLGKFIGNVLHGLGAAQMFLVSKLNLMLPEFGFKVILVKVIVLLLVPMLLSLIAAFIYWLIKRRELPRLLELIWIMWLISSLIFVMHV